MLDLSLMSPILGDPVIEPGSVEVFLTNAAVSDGGIYSSGAIFYTSYPPNSTYWLWSRTNGPGWVYMLFRDVQIPQGATLDTASITVRAVYNGSASCIVDIFTVQEDDPIEPISTADLQARSLGVAKNWDIPAWVSGNYYETPDIATQIQEIVSRPLWAAGNDLMVVAKTVGGSDNNYRICAASTSQITTKLDAAWSE